MTTLENILEIILITYNRKKHLRNTFEQIFAPNSPIKNFPITILDNASTDGTADLIKEYQKEFPNIKHIVNTRNIGGNANIVRAFEMVKKEYFWILCDDDNYDWTHWQEVEEAIYNKKDIIVVEHLTKGHNLPIEVIVNELCFLPAGIYKSELLSADVIHNAYANIYNSFPHQALVCECVNKNKEFFVSNYPILIQNIDKGENMGYKRGYKENIHFRIAHFSLFSGMVNSFQMIKDKKIRNKCCSTLYLGRNFYGSMRYFLKTNGIYSYNVCDIFNGVSFINKIIFLLAMMAHVVFDCWFFVYKNSNGHFVYLFKTIKLKFYSSKWFEKIFSIKNSKDKKSKELTILGFQKSFPRKNK